MNFRLTATQRAVSDSGTPYDHIVWMGQFEDEDEEDAFEFARSMVGQECAIQREEIPLTLH